MTAGRVVQGGSTLTQQVAKTLFLTNARTTKRKVQELLLTLWLERHFTKQEILEIYLNRVYLGSGAWGMDAAAKMYFGVSARRLTLAQAAVLAGLPRAPSRFNPRVNPAAALARGKEVLAAMAEPGAITADQAKAAAAQITFPPSPTAPGWFADWVAEQSQTLLAPDADAVLRTTLDSRDQAVAESRLVGAAGWTGAAANVGQGAVVVIDAASGAVRAMVGGRNFHDQPVQSRGAGAPAAGLGVQAVRLADGAGDRHDAGRHGAGCADPHRQLEPGELRAPLCWRGHPGGGTGAVDQHRLGPPPAAIRRRQGRRRHRRSAGIADKLPNDASLALGTGEVGLLELTAAYAPFFNGGNRVVPFGLDRTPHQTEPVIEPEQAAMMARMLGAVVSRGSGRAAAVPGRVVAGKTGTTQDFGMPGSSGRSGAC